MIEISHISPQNLTKKLQRIMPTLPYKVGEVVVKLSMNRFSEQSWVDSSTQPWKVRNKLNSGRQYWCNQGRCVEVCASATPHQSA